YRRRGWVPLNRLFDMLGRNADLSRRVDLMSRITFPSLFTAFLVFYYTAYVKQQSNLDST
ncbi:hypothetical protein GCK32_006160, partial [Trichostrongylus colubriformis]